MRVRVALTNGSRIDSDDRGASSRQTLTNGFNSAIVLIGNLAQREGTNEVGCLGDSDERGTSSRWVSIGESNYLR